MATFVFATLATFVFATLATLVTFAVATWATFAVATLANFAVAMMAGLAGLAGLASFARAAARATLRAFVVKHFSNALSTFCSISSAFSRTTSDTSEMMSALARSSIRFSRNDRLLDLLKYVRLLSTSAMS